jgi:hypothetical protein
MLAQKKLAQKKLAQKKLADGAKPEYGKRDSLPDMADCGYHSVDNLDNSKYLLK